MCLVDHGEAIGGAFGEFQLSGGLVGGDGDAAGPGPVFEGCAAVASVHLRHAELAVLLDLPAPVLEHARGANHEEPGLPDVLERHHRRDGLDGLSQAHLVAKQGLSLVEDVLHAPLLIASQGAVQALREEGLVLDLAGEFLGEAEERVVVAKGLRHDVFQDVDDRDGVRGELRPSLVCGHSVLLELVHTLERGVGLQGGLAHKEGVKAVICARCLLTLLRGGEEPGHRLPCDAELDEWRAGLLGDRV